MKTIAESPQPLVSLRVSDILGKSNQAIYTSVDSLIDSKILSSSEQEGKKILKLTDKGACYCYFYCKVNYQKTLFNHKYLKRPIEIQMIEEIIADNEYYDSDRKSRQVYKRSLYDMIFQSIIKHDEFANDGSFLYREDVTATAEDRNMGAVDYAKRVLRVLNYLLWAHPPHHQDWCNKGKMEYYRDVSKRYFNSYIKFVNDRLTFF